MGPGGPVRTFWWFGRAPAAPRMPSEAGPSLPRARPGRAEPVRPGCLKAPLKGFLEIDNFQPPELAAANLAVTLREKQVLSGILFDGDVKP